MVPAGGDNAHAIRTECRAVHYILMLERGRECLAGGDLPDVRRTVPARADDARAVGAERRCHHGAMMLKWRRQRLTRGDLPDARGVVATCNTEACAVGAERGAVHARAHCNRWDSLRSEAELDRLARGGIPEADASDADGDHSRTIGAERGAFYQVEVQAHVIETGGGGLVQIRGLQRDGGAGGDVPHADGRAGGDSGGDALVESDSHDTTTVGTERDAVYLAWMLERR